VLPHWPEVSGVSLFTSLSYYNGDATWKVLDVLGA
jgi:hypothetical protein